MDAIPTSLGTLRRFSIVFVEEKKKTGFGSVWVVGEKDAGASLDRRRGMDPPLSICTGRHLCVDDFP